MATVSKNKAQDFLLEIGCEEIPADYMPWVLDFVKEGPAVSGGLASAASVFLGVKGAVWKRIRSFGTPRRLVLYVEGLEPTIQREDKGPPVRIAYDAQGHPTKAAEAFAKKYGIHVSQLTTMDTSKEPVLAAPYVLPIQKVLAEAVPEILKCIVFPKKMRWDDSGVAFARPIRWLLSVYDSKPIPCAYGNVKASTKTFGTRRNSDRTFVISSWKQYSEFIQKQGIELEHGLGIRLVNPLGPDTYAFEEPRHPKQEALKRALAAAAKKCGGCLPDQTTEEFGWLLNTATFLAEDPTVHAGSFRPEYLELPSEVLATSMAKHLKLFSVFSPDGKKLLPKFLVVLEGKPAQPARVMAHVERILEARFSDARFFWKEDTRAPLEAKASGLAQVVFHEKLGTVEERIPRLEKWMNRIADSINLPDLRPAISRAARLAKADLVTQMVREFPSLQGIIGGQYARQSGEPEAVARAIAEQYRPRAAGDPVPSTPLGALLSLADRIDTLIGYFGVGLKPTGSADPYGLRRQALGIVRILLEPPRGVSFVGLSIDSLFEQGIQSWGSRITADPTKLKEELFLFLRERFETLSFVAGEINRPLVAAVLDADGGDFAGAKERLDLLQAWWAERPGGPKRRMLERAAKVAERTGRIVRSAGSMELPAQVDPGAFREPVEKELWETWSRVAPKVRSHLDRRQFEPATEAYSALYAPVHSFFEKVFVMDEDMNLRRNRLALLREIFGGLAGQFADLSNLPL